METTRSAAQTRQHGSDTTRRRNPPQVTYTRPWIYPKQHQALFAPRDKFGNHARFALVEASTKTGKTVGCIIWLFEQAYRNGKPGRNYWWVAPSYGQAEIAYRRLKLFAPKNLITCNETRLTIKLPNGATLWFKSGENPDGLYGEDVYAAVIDEASRMRAEAWYALRSTLTATRGPARIIGNVKGRKNWFYDLCREAEKGALGLSYKKLIAKDAVDAGVLVASEVEAAKRDLPDAVFRELYLAEPSDDQGNPFGYEAIQSCVVEMPSVGRTVAWGWDLAKSVDWTVGVGLDSSGVQTEFHRWQRPWSSTIDDIKRLVGNAPALIDSTGVGDPIVELLQKGGNSNYEGYHFTSASKQKLMEGLAHAVQSKTVRYADPVVKIELEQFEYTYSRTGVRYSAPEGCHDDTVCALALAVEKLKAARKGVELWEQLGAKH